MDELLTYHPLLKQAYDEMHLLKYAILCKNSELFFDLIDQLPKSLPDWFRKKLTFFKKHKEGISNALHLPYSNGIVEGLNNKIKVIKRVAYGYRNFINFRTRIYLIQGERLTKNKRKEK